jgi:hypothetical protein
VIHHQLEDAARVEETVNVQELYVRNLLGQDGNVKVGYEHVNWIGLA